VRSEKRIAATKYPRSHIFLSFSLSHTKNQHWPAPMCKLSEGKSLAIWLKP